MSAADYRPDAGRQSLPASPSFGRRLAGSAKAETLATGVLYQIALINVVSGGLVALGRLQLAALCMWAILGMAISRLVVLRRPDEVACLLIGAAPIINLLRGVALYSGVPLLYVAAVGYLAWSQPVRTRQLLGQPTLPSVLVVLSVVYYFLTLVTTFDFRENIRVLELAGAAVIICYLPARRDLLQTAIAGLLISALAVGVSAFPHLQSESAGRLGIIIVEDLAIGNPFTLGTPLALGVLALCLDRGQWLGLANRPALRLALLFPTVGLLALSTSRASWLITTAGLITSALIAKRQRLRLVFAIFAVALASAVLSATPLAETVMKGWNRTFTKDRDASSGRTDQWKVFFYAFTDSPRALLAGYGPGNGRSVFAKYSLLTPNIERGIGGRVPFHGLIMHVGAALGLLGLIPLGVWLLWAARKAVSAFARTSLALPMVSLLGFVLASLTVTGFDTVSGSFLGLGLIAGPGDSRFRQRSLRTVKSKMERGPRGAILRKPTGRGGKRLSLRQAHGHQIAR